MSSAKNEGIGLCQVLPLLSGCGEDKDAHKWEGSQMGQKKPRRAMFALVRSRHIIVLPSYFQCCVHVWSFRCSQMSLECSSMSSTCSQESPPDALSENKTIFHEEVPWGRKCHWEVSSAPLPAERPVFMTLHDFGVSLKESSFHFPTVQVVGHLQTFRLTWLWLDLVLGFPPGGRSFISYYSQRLIS